MTWLDKVIEQHKDFESPISFWRWSALAALSAVVKDHVYLDRYMYKCYANIYVMLYADSGLKKGPPIAMANKLVQSVNNTNIIRGRSSIQAILKDMATAMTLPGGKIKSVNSVFISSSELSSSLVEDPAATKILTDLFDRNYNEGEWKSLLKSDTFKLTDPIVTMLSGTNEAMSEDLLNSSAVKGGFLARTFIIHETKRNKVNSLAFQPDTIPDYKETAKYLFEISQLKGPFRPLSQPLVQDDYYNTPVKIRDRTHYISKVGLAYHNWYDRFIEMVDSQDIKDETGTLNRFGDSVIKVAMLLSLAECPKLEISLGAMNEAIRICEQLLGNVRKTTMSKNGLSTASHLKGLIINELLNIRENHVITRAMLSKKFYMHYGSIEELDMIMQAFHASGMIKTENQGDTILYRMPEGQVKQLHEFLAGKGNRKQ